MCPDPQILSIYLDGELPSPWKEKMEAHLTVCPKCKEKLENYKRMHDLFRLGVSHVPEEQKRVIVERDGQDNNSVSINASETVILEKSKERVWKKLASSAPGVRQRYSNNRNYSLWRKRLSVPVPIAAAAALLIVFGFMIYMQNANTASNNQITEFPNLTEEMPVEFLPVNTASDINSVLQYLDANGTDIIILQLPESKNFSRAGEPEIVRAADYSRANNSLRRQP